MITRRDWWIGVTLIVLALLVHGLVPRYDFRQFRDTTSWTRIDRWTGSAALFVVDRDGMTRLGPIGR